MVLNYKPDERELIRLVTSFKKKLKALVQQNKTTEDYTQLLETADKLIEQITIHATSRETVHREREKLKSLIKENAVCPKCNKNANLKLIGTDKSPEGWKSNKYRCKKCNIEFVWNAPNNPWDMVPYAENFIVGLEKKILMGEGDEETTAVVEQLKANLAKLKPVVEAADLDLKDIETRDNEMADMIHKFKKYLMIEKIKMED
jgi:hypothetical protein